jgi:hypothetical protein
LIFLALHLLIQALLVVHVIKTGRNMLWILAIALLPGIGWLAYIVVEMLPDLFRGRTARRASSRVQRLMDPDKELREASAAVEVSGNVDARRRLAEQLHQRGEFARAMEVCSQGLRGVFEHDPSLLYGLARAQFAAGLYGDARDSLARLREHDTGIESPEVGLLYARSLQAAGDLEQAEREYAAISSAYPGAEARLRYAQLLKQLGKTQDAQVLLRDLLQSARVAPPHYRKAQGEWLRLAERELG